MIKHLKIFAMGAIPCAVMFGLAFLIGRFPQALLIAGIVLSLVFVYALGSLVELYWEDRPWR